MNYYVDVLKKYAEFKGRASRKEFWMFTLFNVLIYVVLFVIDALIGKGTNILTGIYTLAVFLPSLGVSVRRLHDTNRSGWWWLLNFIPFVGTIVVLIFEVLDSQPGQNQYGPNPKGL